MPFLHLAAGFAQDPSAHFKDEAALLGDGDEFRGPEFLLQTLDSQQRLEAQYPAVQRTLRLIAQTESIVSQRFTQTVFDVLRARRRLFHVRLEQPDLIL